MKGQQAIFNLQIKKKSGLSLNPDIHHSKVFSSDLDVKPDSTELTRFIEMKPDITRFINKK